MPPRSNLRRARRAGKRPQKKRAGKRSSPTHYATITETVEFNDLNSNTSKSCVFSLAQFERASAIAPNFRWYKATKVTWIFEPLFNTYQDGVGGDSIPFLYKLMDRTQNQMGMYKPDLQGCGVKPIKLTSPKSFSYVPNWCSAGLTTYQSNVDTGSLTGINAQGLRPQYSFLATPDKVIADQTTDYMLPIDGRTDVPVNSHMNAVALNAVCYNGMDIFLDQDLNSNNPKVCRLRCIVTWVFKDPKFHSSVVGIEPVQLKTVEV